MGRKYKLATIVETGFDSLEQDKYDALHCLRSLLELRVYQPSHLICTSLLDSSVRSEAHSFHYL
jgi:hypothetical protein